MNIKRLKFAILIAIFFIVLLSASAQLLLNNGGIVTFKGGSNVSSIYIVLNIPPSTPIKTIVTTGAPTNGIVMEDEYNNLHYNLTAATTSIKLPYLSNTL
jgi:hypothetical protein